MHYQKQIKLQYIFIIFPFLAFILYGCTGHKQLEGKWETRTLLLNGQELETLPSYIVFVPDGKQLIIKGDAGVNLFKAEAQIKNKSFESFSMSNTGFSGKRKEMEFEDLFFRTLMNASSFHIEDNILHLSAPSEDLELLLEKSSEQPAETK